MSVIRWQDPPPPGIENTGRPKHLIGHELIAVQLKRRPGEWAVVYETNNSTSGVANLIRRAQLRPYRPAGSFEAVARSIAGVNTIFARYVGEQS